MIPDDPELLAARLARMKPLVEALEAESASSAQQQTFLKLRRELQAARDALKPTSE